MNSKTHIEVFKNFMSADSLSSLLEAYQKALKLLKMQPTIFDNFYPKLKQSLSEDSYIKSFLDELNYRAMDTVYFNVNNERDYLKGQYCMVIGGSACGLRTAIELQLLGAESVLIIDKREDFKSNNFVHLWSYIARDLRKLGARKLHSNLDSSQLIDHIQTTKLELLLLKIALVLGCDFVNDVEFDQICPLSLEKKVLTNECFCNLHLSNESFNQTGAFAHFNYSKNDFLIKNKLNTFAFNILIQAEEQPNFLNKIFTRSEVKGKPTIAIIANFLNDKSTSINASLLTAVNYYEHPHLFQILNQITGVNLEKYRMYMDEKISFVFTPRKSSLIESGVLIKDCKDENELFLPKNINNSELLNYSRNAALFLTGLTDLKFATKNDGQPDCTIRDFTTTYASENSCCVKEILLRSKCCKKSALSESLILIALVGNALHSPNWNLLGSSMGRGFFSSMDTAWLCKNYGACMSSKLPKDEIDSTLLEIIAERESIYKLLRETTPKNINQNFEQYTIQPSTRYLNLQKVTPFKPENFKHLLLRNFSSSNRLHFFSQI